MPTLKLSVIKTKSPERLSRAKNNKIGYIYKNTSSTLEKIILRIKTNSKIYKTKIY